MWLVSVEAFIFLSKTCFSVHFIHTKALLNGSDKEDEEESYILLGLRNFNQFIDQFYMLARQLCKVEEEAVAEELRVWAFERIWIKF